jgi:hypothetical protein
MGEGWVLVDRLSRRRWLLTQAQDVVREAPVQRLNFSDLGVRVCFLFPAYSGGGKRQDLTQYCSHDPILFAILFVCSSYTPAQRLYLGKPVVDAWFGGHSEVNRMFSGYSTYESGYKVVAPEIFTNPGSRVDRSGVTRQIRSRGGRVGGGAP